MAVIHTLSYNMTGFRTGADYIKDVIRQSEPTIVFLQETWHLANACNHLGQIDDDYFFIECSGVDCSNAIMSGRPSGGVVILYKKSIAGSINKVTSSSNRICSVLLSSKDGLNDILFINIWKQKAYMGT